MILPCWFFVYVMYRGTCVTIYEFFGWVLETFGGTVEDGVELPKLNWREFSSEAHGFSCRGCASAETVLLISASKSGSFGTSNNDRDCQETSPQHPKFSRNALSTTAAKHYSRQS
jgi:hypothetical protein